MRGIRMKALGCLLILLLVMIPISVAAYDYTISPTEWDFGDVAIGSSSTQIFGFTNDEAVVDIIISTIMIQNASSESFQILSAVPPLSIIVPHGETSEIIVKFSPTSLGPHSADVQILSNAAIPEALIPIEGVGVPEEVPPNELMAELIESFNECVENESVEGSGPGRSASGRLKAFGNMLKASSDLISAGEYETACVQLQDALNRIDGVEPPPDFVIGLNAENLASMIGNVMNELGCP